MSTSRYQRVLFSIIGVMALPCTAMASDYYVACQATTAGDGSAASPFNALDQINKQTLKPGDKVFFASGSVCKGSFKPKGGGSDSQPVIIGKSGSGKAPLIDGNGTHDAILIENMANVTLQDLEVINAASPGSERNGVQLRLADYGVAKNVTVKNLTIHNVRGGDNKKITGSAGILISVMGTNSPSNFDKLTIDNNTIYDVDRSGIYFKSLWNKRAEVGKQDTSGVGPWTPSTGVVVRGNKLSSIAGDGIKIDTVQGALIERNTLAGFQLRSKENNAGIWAFNTQDVTVQYNDVSGGGNSHDGMSFDADGGAINTLFQYNYSHNNAGGLLLLCPYSGAVTNNTIMRYNVSYNDKARLFQVCPGVSKGNKIYNNTIYHEGKDTVLFFQNDNSPNVEVEWANNIVVNSGPEMKLSTRAGQQFSFYNNDFIGVGTLPNNPEGGNNKDGLTLDPQFVGPVSETNPAAFALQSGSPARNAGKVIADNGGKDYAGTPISATEVPTLGAFAQ